MVHKSTSSHSHKSSTPDALRDIFQSLSSVKDKSREEPMSSENDSPKVTNNVAETLSGPNTAPTQQKTLNNVASNFGESQKNEKVVIEVLRRKEILKLVGCMNATVGARTAEQGLLR